MDYRKGRTGLFSRRPSERRLGAVFSSMEGTTTHCVGTLALRSATYDLAVRSTSEQLHLRLEDREENAVWTGTFNARCMPNDRTHPPVARVARAR